MTDEAVAAPAAPETTAAPEAPAKATEPAKAPSAREAIENAIRQVAEADKVPEQPASETKQKADTTAKPEAKKEAEPTGTDSPDKAPETSKTADKTAKSDDKTSQTQPRDESGKFTKAEGTDADKAPEQPKGDEKEAPKGFATPPDRFSPDAKAAWAEAPLAVRAEAVRMERELSDGLDKYRADAEAFEPYREIDARLKHNNRTLDDAIGAYVQIEDMLHKDPIQGLDHICRNLGMTLQDVAAQITGQTPDQAAAQHNNALYAMQQKIADLEGQLASNKEWFEAAEKQRIQTAIAEFAKEHPRYEELEGYMDYLILNKDAETLEDAYALADAHRPVQQPTNQEDPPQNGADTPPTNAQTKGQLSPDGAPASGSNPDTPKTPPKSAREAVDEAFRQQMI